MVKLLLLVSTGTPPTTLLILTLQVVEGGPVTGDQVRVPLLGVFATKGSQVEPSLVTSIFTLSNEPVEVQVMFFELPIAKESPPLGDVTVMLRGRLMVKLALLIPDGTPPPPAFDTLTLHRAEGVLGMVHGCTPSFGVFAMIVFHPPPPLVEYSILTLSLNPSEIQVIL
jgi:hypothetical protein